MVTKVNKVSVNKVSVNEVSVNEVSVNEVSANEVNQVDGNHGVLLQGGSLFSPAALQPSSSARAQALELASQLGCPTPDPSSPDSEDKMAACLRQTPVHALNAAQTKVHITYYTTGREPHKYTILLYIVGFSYKAHPWFKLRHVCLIYNI